LLGWRPFAILLVLAAGLGGVFAWHRHVREHRVLPADSRSPSQAVAPSSTRATVNRQLQEWGEAPPLAACQTKAEGTISLLADALVAMRPAAGTQADPKKAIAILAKADIGSAERWVMLARAQFLDGDDAGVVNSAQRGLDLCPEYAAAHNLLGKAMQRTGKLVEAEAAFRRALASDKEFVAPKFNLALLFLKKGDAGSAITILSSLIERSPDTPNAFLVRAQARLLAKDFAGAEADLREAARRNPEEADAWHLLGQVLTRKGDKAEAHKALCRAKLLGATLSDLTCDE
jgi:tetratricopeptide (TPR) repeat protein